MGVYMGVYMGVNFFKRQLFKAKINNDEILWHFKIYAKTSKGGKEIMDLYC